MSLKSKGKKRSGKIIVAVSGGFDPLHPGHIRLFNEAKALGDELVVILNNDNWLKKKKGYSFMSAKERKEVIESMRAVDRVVISHHKPNPKDMSVVSDLKKLMPDIFANGGDRTNKTTPELVFCQKAGIKMAFSVGRGGKVQSSSWLLAKYSERISKKKSNAR